MNSSLIILVAIIAVPAAVLMAFRINATLVFLSLCLGNVLTQFVADDTGSFISMFSAKSTQAAEATPDTIKLALLLFPVVLTAVFMVKTVRGSSKQFLNALPAVGVGLLGALLVVPLLPGGTAANIMNSSLWDEVTKLQDLIVGASAMLCLFVLWLQRPKTGHDEKHSKHHG